MNRAYKIKQAILQELPFFFCLPAFIWQLFFLCIPLVVMILMSIVDRAGVASALIVTTKNYVAVLDFLHFKIILNSLFLALVVAFSCLLVAYPVAYFLAFKAGRFKQLCLFFLLVPFWTNLLILIYAWFFILERDGLLNRLLTSLGLIHEPLALLHNLFAISIVMFYCYMPFMIMPLVSALEKVDENLLEASRDLGATYWQTFLRVILPLSWPGIRTGFFLVYVLAFGEFAIPLLMGGDKYVFVGTAISHYVLNALEIERGAAFTCMSGICLLISIVLLNWLLKKIIYRV
ncbi:MAG TPA: ABC transporter permease [Candidatus Babeliales bacterium]|nr:ABC transporter permease [Candidatus Babeliales bacterium]